MAHLTMKESYKKLVDRLNRFPQGAPPSDLLYKILEMLFSEKEAEYVSLLPIKPFTAKKAAKIWKKPLAESQSILETLADRGILADVERNGEAVYTLPPPMAGFFEFSMMRLRTDIDQKILAELFYQYLNVEEDFIKRLFTDGETQLGRVFVHEPALTNDNALHVLDYERTSEVIKTASHMGVGICYCRHKMEHLGRACAAPMDICMTFNSTAESLTRHGIARAVDVREGLDLLQTAYQHNLVQFGENIRENVNFICNCCGCCCEAMLAAKRFGMLNPVHTTNFIPGLDATSCTGCGKCVDVCPVEAMGLVSANDPHEPRKRKARLNEDICLGCGVCVRNCAQKSISLNERPRRVITPLNSAHKAVVMAIERGKLQHLLFDNRALWNHRVMAAILGVILKLPPIKQVMAGKQMKSRYLEHLFSRPKF
ncbi:MAG: 4Fe-4S dicluster domain-containing protein [Candidatus Aminicenantes bacterium]|nr:4Fe-4S dicluster domain-containing protein [Candidatus Aminicenantes bacterium]